MTGITKHSNCLAEIGGRNSSYSIHKNGNHISLLSVFATLLVFCDRNSITSILSHSIGPFSRSPSLILFQTYCPRQLNLSSFRSETFESIFSLNFLSTLPPFTIHSILLSGHMTLVVYGVCQCDKKLENWLEKIWEFSVPCAKITNHCHRMCIRRKNRFYVFCRCQLYNCLILCDLQPIVVSCQCRSRCAECSA